MINLFTARENIDKERFIYDNVVGKTIVLVPNQYTLVAEEQALKQLKSNCLFDIEILSMDRLGLNILREQGIESTRMLDKYGRFMLVNKIVKRHESDLKIFKKMAKKQSFINMVSDFISDFKQQDCSVEELEILLEKNDIDDLLKDKLKELKLIINDYEEAIAGKYMDSEDFIRMYVDAIKDSKLVLDKDIWIYGYDSITPKFITALVELSKRAKSLNYIVNKSDFELHNNIVKKIKANALKDGEELVCSEISSEYELKKSETIKKIEHGLFSQDLSENEIKENENFTPEDLTLVEAANPYYEVETAANYIYALIREHGYKMNEIQVISNDESVMHPIIRRTFDEYGLTLFVDHARKITDTVAVRFVVNMLLFQRYRKTKDLMAMLKTGFAGIEYNDAIALENYANIYGIKNYMWEKPFKYRYDDYSEEKLDKVESLRQKIMASFLDFENLLKSKKVSDFIKAFKNYLNENWKLQEQIEALVEELNNEKLLEDIQRNVQAYNKMLDILDQMDEIMGDEDFEFEEFLDIFQSGLTRVEVGIIPPSIDGISLGTMIRTRPRPVKAVVILGANEGTLPLQPSIEGLFSVDEKSCFNENEFAIGSLDDIKITEENVAMYRVVSKASEKLYVSYALANHDGESQEPSVLINSLCDLFPKIEKDNLVKKDIISEGWTEDRINSPNESLRHMINHLKDRNTTEMDPLSKAVIEWTEKKDKEKISNIINEIQDENDPKDLDRKVVKTLYANSNGTQALSATSLSTYVDCPFKFFIDNGLKPKEERKFSSDPRSIGQVYHKCLENIANDIIKNRSLATEILNSDKNKIEKIVSEELDKISEESDGGLLISNSNEKYRLNRIKEVCKLAVLSLAKQLSNDRLDDLVCEEYFGGKGTLKPIEFEVEGEKVYINGVIDRLDYFDNGRVRVVDYKTGSDKLDINNLRQGYKMQLMIYMMSATSDEYEPAGMYYFNIKEEIENANKSTKVYEEKKIEDTFKLNGKYIDEEGVLETMPRDVLKGTRDLSISKELYDEVKMDVKNIITDKIKEMLSGKINIYPLKVNKQSSCKFCKYKSICKRDITYYKNRSNVIDAKSSNNKG